MICKFMMLGYDVTVAVATLRATVVLYCMQLFNLTIDCTSKKIPFCVTLDIKFYLSHMMHFILIFVCHDQ